MKNKTFNADSESSPGPSVDANGRPVVDPTENVIALSQAASERQDDLRSAETIRIDQLRAAESRRLEDMASLRADYEKQLREAEAKRIDAIREVDVAAVKVASDRAADQATVLANQVVASAEALRTLVASTAATVATSLAQLSSALSARIATLEQGSYTSQGKSSMSDPAMAEMLIEIKALRTSQSTVSGKSEGINSTWVIVIAIGAAAVVWFASRTPTPVQPATPQIIYATPTAPPQTK